MRKKVIVILIALTISGVSFSSEATPVTFFGEDLTFGGRTNADAAYLDFVSNLENYGSEDFESESIQVGLVSSPLALDFGVAGGATLSGAGWVNDTNLGGRWATSGEKYWQTRSEFVIDFETPTSAFGFYGTDIGDGSGHVILTYSDGTSHSLNIGNTAPTGDGTGLFFGFYESDLTKSFSSISILGPSQQDWMGFDDMVIGDVAPVPEPATIILFGSGIVGLLGARLRKNNRSR